MSKKLNDVNEFRATTNASDETAYDYLNANDWNLFDALVAFYDDRAYYA